MFRAVEMKCGGVVLETDCELNTIQEGRTDQIHFLYLTVTDMEQLYHELGSLLMDRDLRRNVH